MSEQAKHNDKEIIQLGNAIIGLGEELDELLYGEKTVSSKTRKEYIDELIELVGSRMGEILDSEVSIGTEFEDSSHVATCAHARSAALLLSIATNPMDCSLVRRTKEPETTKVTDPLEVFANEVREHFVRYDEYWTEVILRDKAVYPDLTPRDGDEAHARFIDAHDRIVAKAEEIIIDNNGQPSPSKLVILEDNYQIMVFAGERDSFGWLTGVIVDLNFKSKLPGSKYRHRIVFG